MPGKWAYIGGGAALLFAGIVASRSDLAVRFGDDNPTVAATAPVASTAVTTLAAPAADDGALDRLAAELTAREAENAELRTTLAVRDAVLTSLKADLAQRETTLRDLEARLAASDAAVATLRQELAALRHAAKLAVFTAGPDEPSAARIETVRAEAPHLDAIFDAAKAPPGLPPLPDTLGAVMVQFDFASAALTPGGHAHAAAAAVQIADMTPARVTVTGHADRVGGPAANRRLAAKRARAVADFLVGAGIPRELIEIDGSGEADLPVATADGVPEPLNRSVEIRILPL